MGIDSLLPLLKKRNACAATTIAHFTGKRIAFDAAIFMHVFFYRGQGTLDDMLKQWQSHVRSCKEHSIYPIVVFDGRKLKGKAEEYKKREAAVKRKHVMLEEHTAKVDALMKDVRIISGMVIPKYSTKVVEIIESKEDTKDGNIITYPELADKEKGEDDDNKISLHMEIEALTRRKQQCATIPRDFFKETETMLLKLGIEIRHAAG
jgi:5'-3' exonuclease